MHLVAHATHTKNFNDSILSKLFVDLRNKTVEEDRPTFLRFSHAPAFAELLSCIPFDGTTLYDYDEGQRQERRNLSMLLNGKEVTLLMPKHLDDAKPVTISTEYNLLKDKEHHRKYITDFS